MEKELKRDPLSFLRVFWVSGGIFVILAVLAFVIGGRLRLLSPAIVPVVGVDGADQTAVPLIISQRVQAAQPVPVTAQTLLAHDAFILQESRGISNLYIEYIFSAANSFEDGLAGGNLNGDPARDLLIENLQSYSPETNIGLRVFKHRLEGAENVPAQCSDVQLVAPMKPGQIEVMAGWLADFKVQGTIPLRQTLTEALKDFDYADSQRVNQIVLISSGQDSCWGDPCQEVQLMRDRGLNVTFFVVGVGVDGAAKEQLSCIAEKGGGIYYDVRSMWEYREALGQIQAQAMAVESLILYPAATASAQKLAGERAATRINGLAEAISAYTAPISPTVTPTLTPTLTAAPTLTSTATAAEVPTVTITPQLPTVTPVPLPEIASPTVAGGGSLVDVQEEEAGCSGMSCGGGRDSRDSGSGGGSSDPGADPGGPGG